MHVRHTSAVKRIDCPVSLDTKKRQAPRDHSQVRKPYQKRTKSRHRQRALGLKTNWSCEEKHTYGYIMQVCSWNKNLEAVYWKKDIFGNFDQKLSDLKIITND